MVSSYRDLDVWRLAMKLAENIYYVTHAFPHRETYALSSQLQRAAVSVASNIAEGHARGYTKDYLRFIAMAMGSLAELETQLELSTRLKYVDENESNKLLGNADELGRMLRGLHKSLHAKFSSPQPLAPHS